MANVKLSNIINEVNLRRHPNAEKLNEWLANQNMQAMITDEHYGNSHHGSLRKIYIDRFISDASAINKLGYGHTVNKPIFHQRGNHGQAQTTIKQKDT